MTAIRGRGEGGGSENALLVSACVFELFICCAHLGFRFTLSLFIGCASGAAVNGGLVRAAAVIGPRPTFDNEA